MTSLRSHPLMHGAPPDWASSWGQDRFGVFAGFALEGVEVRMRWIEGGRFVMGSPEDEEGRYGSWGLRGERQHEVTVSGFWLGETPVTQQLWQVATGNNPSRFQSHDRPVEQVGWHDCVDFMDQVNQRVPGLALRLPTEAEWEYACRAGTATATYGGDLTIVGERSAPVLDAIAWHGGNSGVGFELSSGYNSSGWRETRFPRNKSGTHPVARKLPNDFGLYDMLGNVCEWCEDWLAPYPIGRQHNPRGPKRGVDRVLRGGSWFHRARDLRAAARDGVTPDFRVGSIGVRLAQGHGEPGAEPQSSPSPPARARGTRARKRGRGGL